MRKTRVLVVDDQNVPREMFFMLIERSEEYELVACLHSAAYAYTYILKTQVDLILMDILMQDGSNGLEVAEKIKQIRPSIKIIAVTSMLESLWIKKARKIGIESFWFKECSTESIVRVMERTMQGESVYPDQLPSVTIGLADSSEFTEREMDVLRVMTAGSSNSVIAEKLGMAESTVKTHIRHMIEKTGCENRTQLAIRARVAGIVVSEEEIS